MWTTKDAYPEAQNTKQKQNWPPVPVMAIITKETTQISGVEKNAKSYMKTLVTIITSSISLNRRAKTNLKVKVHVLIVFPTHLKFTTIYLLFQNPQI